MIQTFCEIRQALKDQFVLQLCIEVLPLVRDGYACHFRVLTAHGQEEKREEVAQKRRPQCKLGRSHNAQLEPLHDHAPRKHPQGDGRDVYDALEPEGTCEKDHKKKILSVTCPLSPKPISSPQHCNEVGQAEINSF